MGICASAESESDPQQRVASRKTDEELNMAYHDTSKVIKLLLLGAGDSGKSTLRKQFSRIYGEGFADSFRVSFLPILRYNLIYNITTLIKYADERTKAGEPSFQIASGAEPSAQYFRSRTQEPDDGGPFTPEMAEHIGILWADPGIQETYANRHLMQINENTGYLLPLAHNFVDPAYVPSDEDILACRAPTTGIVEEKFTINGHKFQVIDVGGQRNERKKWIHSFANVSSVIFVAALSGYNQTLYEDDSMNRMDEAINLFDNICNSQWFQKVSFMLFLNKMDRFQEKLQTQPLNEHFKDYTGTTIDDATEYIQKLFLAKNSAFPDRPIYTHVTCARDKSNIEFVFNTVQSILLSQSLTVAGLGP